MAVPVDRHADAVGERGERDDDLGVVARHAVVANDRRLDVVLRQLAQELERDVRDDLDVHPGVVVDLHARDRVHVRDVPPALELLVLVHALDQRPELAVAAHRHVDPHALDRLGGREPALLLGLRGDGLVDPVGGLLVRSFSSIAIAEHTSADTSLMQHDRASRPARRRGRPPAQPADGLLPAAPRDPALHLGLSLVDRGLLRGDRRTGS